ncbi:MAG: hypothetical protein AAGH45_12505 [Pseudomonadota bacterium]
MTRKSMVKQDNGTGKRSPKVAEFENIRDEIITDQVQENLDFLGRMFSLPLPIVAILLLGFAAGMEQVPVLEMDIPRDLIGNTVVVVLIFLIIQAYIATRLIKQIYTRSDEPEVVEFILKTHASIFNPYRDGLITGLAPILAQGLVFALVITAAGNHYGWYGESLDFGNLCAPGEVGAPLIVNNILEAAFVVTCKLTGTVYVEPPVYEAASVLLSLLFLSVVLFYGVTFLIFALTLEHPRFPHRRVINGPVLAYSKIVLFMLIVISAFFPKTLMALITAPFV